MVGTAHPTKAGAPRTRTLPPGMSRQSDACGQRIGHSLLAFGLAIVGGLIALRFADDRTDAPDAP